MSQIAFRRLLVPLAAVCSLLAGCVIESPLAVRRFWGDYNTLQSPALYYEKTSRVPMDSARVRELRWRYNLGPDSNGTIAPAAPPTTTTSDTIVKPDAASGPPAAQFSPLPPEPGKMETPAPVAGHPPDAGRTAQSRDAWRFVH